MSSNTTVYYTKLMLFFNVTAGQKPNLVNTTFSLKDWWNLK